VSDNDIVKNTITDTALNRRSFLKWSAALSGTAVLASSGGAGLTSGLKQTQTASAAAESKVLTTSCYHNCGGRCILKAEVKEGAVVRLLPDTDPDEDPINNPRAIPCVRGRSQIRRVYSAERLKYPMKRVGKRGEGKFERISWDEALDTIASEMTRIKEQYGNEAFYYHYASGQIGGGIDMTYKGTGPLARLLHMFGGYVNFYGTYSSACYGAVVPYITGSSANNSVDDLLNSKLVVLWADNPLVTRNGGKGDGYYHLLAKENGAKYIVIDPRMSDSVIALEADWVPINPGTDVALIAALAYVMIEEDIYDKEFVDKYTVGFHEDNLPEGAPENSSWMAYVMGDADGEAKTPEWAEPITGIPASRIRTLAREMALTKPCAMLQGLGWQRRAYGEQAPRALPILAAMTGNVGIAGGGMGLRSGRGANISMGGFPAGQNPIEATISVFMWPDFIKRGKEMTSGPRDRIKGAEKLNQNMKFMLNWAGNTLINQHSDVNGTTELLQDESLLEFILVGDVAMTPSARFADILLPDCTSFEVDNLLTGNGEGRANFAVYSHKLVDPLFESRDVLWIAEQLADRLGMGEEFREGRTSREDWLREMVDIARENDPNFPTYEEFKEKGIYKISGKGQVVANQDFVDDPEANPLPTETGKIEIFSPHLFAQNDPDEIPAIPKYIPEWEGVSDPLRETYPLMLVGSHAIQRSHSTFDDVDILQEAHPQVVWINTLDARERGIENGETVRIFNDRGTVLLPAFVTPRIRPGVVNIPQGAWYTPDASGVDIRGAINTLTKYHPTPFAKGNPQHTNLVQVEKA